MDILKKLGLKGRSIYSERDEEIMKRYKDGAKIREDDEEVLDRYAQTGFVEFGPTFDTAILTRLGRDGL